MKKSIINFKTKLILSLVLLLNITLFAQSNYTVNGTVISKSDSAPLPGVTLIIEGTTNGASTDFDGNFQLNVKKGDKITASYVGFVTKTISITDQNKLTISLEEDSNQLDEVVVVGYGTRKKSHLTGAVAKVGGKDIASVQVARVDEALAGKLAGVLIQNQSGEPGADPKIQIRAASSISGNSNPLVVVDGFPISGSLATVNSNDIQSMEVLKDAASAAIYGSRGANGVILVTTKSGKPGKTKFSYNTYLSMSNKYRDNILKTGSEWASQLRSEIANGERDLSHLDANFVEYRLSAYEDSPNETSVEDWLYQTGTTQSHDFSMSGGTEDAKFFASVGYQDAEGIVRTQGFKKYNARLKVDANLGDKFKAGLNFNGFMSDRTIVAHDMRDLSRAYSVHPVYHTEESIAFVQELDAKAQALGLGLKTFDEGFNNDARGLGYNESIYTLKPGDYVNDWHYGKDNNGIGGSGDQGPATKLDNAEQWQKTYFANISSYLEYSIAEGLKIKTVLGGDLNDTQDYYYQGLEADAKGRLNQTDLDQIDLKKSSVLSETTLSYAKEIGEHDISAVVGVEFQNTYFKGTSTVGTNVPFESVVNYNLLDPADIIVTERNETRTRQGIFGRLNYAYKDRYLASASVRRDGDSRFGANNRFQIFPAVSLGWNVHKEAFLEDNDVLSKLKLRVSTGSLGTASFLGSYDSMSLLNASPTVFGTGFLIPSDVSNPDLTWQTNTETNYGVDFGFLNGRFSLSVDYYTSDIEDILISQSVSEVLGTNQIKLNSGDVQSSGLEFELNANLISNNDFSWNVSANLSTVTTEITDLGGLNELTRETVGQSGRDLVFRNYVGGQIGEMWGLETTGQVEDKYLTDPTRHPNYQSGLYYVKDQQSVGEPGYGEIDNTRTVEEGGDLVKVGQNTPDFYWGLNSSMKYKAFDMAFQIQGSQGAEVYNIDPYYYGSQWGTSRMRITEFDADSNGISDDGRHYKDAKGRTDANIQDASYVALRNLTIGYTVDQDFANKIGLSSVRLYGAATNLFYLMGDNYTSYNPEGIETTGDYTGPTTSGFQVGASPVVRSFTLGLNINF
jgi:TonB-linked SusC/RagA family outer membrane protein